MLREDAHLHCAARRTGASVAIPLWGRFRCGQGGVKSAKFRAMMILDSLRIMAATEARPFSGFWETHCARLFGCYPNALKDAHCYEEISPHDTTYLVPAFDCILIAGYLCVLQLGRQYTAEYIALTFTNNHDYAPANRHGHTCVSDRHADGDEHDRDPGRDKSRA
jgi:hypothetical protein